MPLKSRRGPSARRDAPAGTLVYQAIKQEIADGTIGPGERLLEQELSDRYEVSRTPVREALRILTAEGLLDDQPGRGLVVSQPTPDEIVEIYFLREMLEGLAGRLAAQRAGETDLARLAQIVKEIASATSEDDDGRVVDLNAQFHFVLWRAARSPRLLKIMEDLQISVRRFQRSTLRYPGRLAQAQSEHMALLEAIGGRRADEAERIAREHMRHVRDIRIAMAAREPTPTNPR